MTDDPAKLRRRANALVIFTASAVALGGLLGWMLPGWLPDDASARNTALMVIGFPGDLLMQMLKMMVVPLVVATMVVGVASLGDIRKAGKIGYRTVGYYALTTGMSVLLGIILVNLIQPGAGAENLKAAGELPQSLREPKGALESLLQVVKGMFPPNLIQAGAEMNVLGLIVFSVVLGAVLSTMGERGRPVTRFFESFNEAIMKIVHLVVWFAPIGIASLLMARMGKAGDAFFEQDIPRLAKYMLTVILGLGVHVLVVLPGIYWLVKKQNPFKYMLGMAQALLTAFSTASSSATLPITMECAKTNNKVGDRAAGFVLPLGATINMDGTALYEAVAVIFIAQSLGMDLSAGQMVVVFFTATLAAIGAAGIPEAGLVMMAIVLTAVGIDPANAGLILAVDWFLDRFRTAVNVAGDAIGAGVIDHLETRDAGPVPAVAG
ncbi:MAG: dicarboxylate/amino acid:cation symporter [Planctomycetes bacterium]|nr:dicarboxylate/amino acid:cation symporter [Planctomycetota bacterium]MCB9936065.1 dicarboxylate/amino acid:cation symporter [Planctomycetota bacterium]